MPSIFRKHSLIFASSLVMLLFVLLIWRPSLGPIDDHELTLTVLRGLPLPPFLSRETGRYYPLNMQDISLISGLAGPSPAWFYAWSALQLLVFSAVLIFSFIKLGMKPALAVLAFMVVVISPGFAHAWFRLGVPERNIVLLLTLFWLPFVGIGNAPRRAVPTALLAFVSALTALFFKEPVFIALGVFCTVALFVPKLQGLSTTTRRLAAIILVGCFLFGAGYVLFIASNPMRSSFVEEKRMGGFVLGAARAWAGFLLSNPIATLGAPLLACMRLNNLRTTRTLVLGDAFLAAALSLVAVYTVLGIYTPYYLWPADMVTLYAVGCYWGKHAFNRQQWLSVLVPVSVLIITSSLPLGINTIFFNKLMPVNFQEVVGFFTQRLESRSRPSICLFGVEPSSNREPYLSLARYLTLSGLGPNEFDLQFLPATGQTAATGFVQDLKGFSVSRSGDTCTPKPGDFLLFVPTSTAPWRGEGGALEKMKTQGWREVMRAGTFGIPNFSLQRLAKATFRAISSEESRVSGSSNDERHPGYVVLENVGPP